MKKFVVAVLLGSDSDLPVMAKAIGIFEEFSVPYEITIASAHRSPARTISLVEAYQKDGVKVIIAAAGMAAHLAGVVAAHFPLPVIGVPLESGALNGVDALYATVQMPPGIPVATVGIDNAQNAGLLAVQILATSDATLEERLIAYKQSLAKKVTKKAENLEQKGFKQYIDDYLKNR
ncbi:MAG: 5-(carboxyamino)imidazole ribonucleotide mutase [Candidatus Levybacteria bacterium]|nr:5-(carboxyamino)imidazole ribonucleotide mutase [Candidatus Levybacteria bacterium]